MNKVQGILQKDFPAIHWNVRKPAKGLKKECFIAANGPDCLFLKLNVFGEEIARLGEIGVAPKILVRGMYDDAPYIIQEYIEGVHPEKNWFPSNMYKLARVIQTYHHDGQLKKLLADRVSADYKTELYGDLHHLRKRLLDIPDREKFTSEVRLGFEKLFEKASSLSEETFVPVHTDPNPGNMLVSNEKLYFIDWDEITMSDPMRDIGVIMWWFLPPGLWSEFFAYLDLVLSETYVNKIYWFAARSSLDIALWYTEHNMGEKGFLIDFLAALNGQVNPR